MGYVVKFVPRPSEMDRLLNNPTGETGRYLRRKGNLIATAARQQVGVNTGALRASIHVQHRRDSRGQFIRVGSPLEYAFYHHRGTSPHIIRPDKANMLKFVKGGRVMYAHAVKHPGTDGNPFLRRNLRLVL